jgi:Protein of unknown function (DUF2723)
MTAKPRASTLFLRLREPGSAYAATLALLAYYAATMSRDLALYDSGELALAAVQLGLGHPPGQPLHTLIGHALSLLPFPKLVGVGLASVVPAALTVVPATSLAQSLCPPDAPRVVLRALPWFIALGALHVAFWEPATRVEVYVLAAFFAVWAIARLSTPHSAQGTRTTRDVLLAGVALGLSASVHPIVAAAAGLSVAPALVSDVLRRRLPYISLLAAIGGGLLGLLPYVYVLVVAQRRDVMVWGAPRDAQSLLHYFLLADYVENHRAGPMLVASHMLSWALFGAQKLLWPLCMLGLVGHLWLRRHSELGGAAAALLFFGLLFKVAFNVSWNLEIPDYLGYVVAALWVLLAGAGAMCAQAYCNGERRAAASLAVILVCASLAAAPHALARTRMHDHFARTLAEQALREAPKNAILITELDHVAGALFYLQEAERARPDVVVVAYGLGSSTWHWEMIHRQHPDLVPVTLHGHGGKPARLRRFLDANPERAVLVERERIAAAIGLRSCPSGLYLRTGQACDTRLAPDLRIARMLRATLDRLGNGAGGIDQAVATTAYDVGTALLRAGHGEAAYITLLAGVPRRMLPPDLAATPASASRAPALRATLPTFGRGAALGDPARNLFMIAIMLTMAGDERLAVVAMRAAADDGMPEAQRMMMQYEY